MCQRAMDVHESVGPSVYYLALVFTQIFQIFSCSHDIIFFFVAAFFFLVYGIFLTINAFHGGNSNDQKLQ